MSTLERPAPPVGDRLDQAVAEFFAAMDSMGNGLAGAREAVGRNRPLTSGQQAHVMGAAGRVVTSMVEYQLAALGIDERIEALVDGPAFDIRLASTVVKGERIQACHGDDAWQVVTHIVEGEIHRGLGDEFRLRWWAPMDPIRVACPAREVSV